MATTAGLMPQACERCWKRKQKCDRQKPACSACRSSSSVCIERRLGNALDPTDPYAHHSYIESLKGKVRMLESQLQASSVSSGAAVSSSPATEPPQSGGTTASTQRRESAVSTSSRPPPPRPLVHDALGDEMGYLPLSAMAELWEQPVSNKSISFQTLVQAATCASGSNPSLSNTQNGAIVGQLGDYHRGLLRQGVDISTIETDEPFQTFLEIAKVIMPFISQSNLNEEYRMVLRAYSNGSVVDLFAANPVAVVMVHLAVAMGILLSKNSRYMESYAIALALTAFQHLPRVVSLADDLQAAQCLAMMAMTSMYTSYGGSAWHLVDLATTRCISAGMHTAKVFDHEFSDPEARARSQIFWTIYALDTFISFSLDRPFQIQDENTTASPPTIMNSDDEAEAFHAWNVQHAILLHELRRSPSKGELFHFSNYRFWRDSAPFRPPNPGENWFRQHHFRRSCCRALVNIVSIADMSQSRKPSPMVASHAEKEFVAFLDALEEQSLLRDGILTVFDGLDAFSAAVALLYLCFARCGTALDFPAISQKITDVDRKILRILTIGSERFKCLNSLYHVFGTFTDAVQKGNKHWLEIEQAILGCELSISATVEKLMHDIFHARAGG